MDGNTYSSPIPTQLFLGNKPGGSTISRSPPPPECPYLGSLRPQVYGTLGFVVFFSPRQLPAFGRTTGPRMPCNCVFRGTRQTHLDGGGGGRVMLSLLVSPLCQRRSWRGRWWYMCNSWLRPLLGGSEQPLFNC